jgi:hypothetical protein
MARPDGRVQSGQKLTTAFSARAWNRAQDAADIVLGDRGGVAAGADTGRLMVLGKTPFGQTWAKGTAQNITLWSGPLGDEKSTTDVIRAWNLFSPVPGDRFVMLARLGNKWYLMAAEC